MPTTRGPSEALDDLPQEVGINGSHARMMAAALTTDSAERQAGDQASVGRVPDAIEVVTIEETIELALGVSRSRLQLSMLVDLEAQLRGHIALLREPAREAADRMWHGSTKWHRHITRLDGVERQTKQELNPHPFGALIEVQLMARDCQWLLDGYKENWR